MPRENAGFTLIELSIVLVIIGLIVGGVLLGEDLIRAASIRKTVGDFQKIQTATNAFRIKYNCLPGDCTNATQYFGTDTSCPSVAYRTTTPVGTCDGDGNGRIFNGVAGSAFFYEIWRFWQQLGNADLIAGKYTGTCGSTGCDAGAASLYNLRATPDLDAPGTPMKQNSIFQVLNIDDATPAAFGTGGFGNSILLCHKTGYGAVISPQSSLEIDSKMDDGKPDTGNVHNILNPMSAADCEISNEYNITTGLYNGCTLIVRGGF